MPSDRPVVPAVDVFASARPDLSAIGVPEMPLELSVNQTRGITLFGVLFA